MRRKAGIALFVFVVAMLCLGILSRAIDATATARITTSKTTSLTMEHKVTARGTVDYSLKSAVFGESGQTISTVYVKEGDWVEEGEALFSVDSSTLDATIDDVYVNIRKLELQIADMDASNAGAAEGSIPSTASSMSKESLHMDKRALQEEYERLLSIRNADYTFYADRQGKVASVVTDAGGVISGSAVLLMFYPESGLCIEAVLTGEEADKIGGSSVGSVDFDEGSPLEDVAFTKTSEDDGSVKMIAEIDGQDVEAGQNCKITFSLSSAQYSTCIPTKSLRQDGSQYYVLVAESRNGFLGEELVARRVNVIVQDTSDGYAALSDGSLSSEQDVLVRSDKVVEDGDKVRVVDA
ncbi:efflux RND transporter periplasmic adaptor subunit [Eggerthella lenta]|uniref:efflux RND transporter periplasmic adaptor subunit n=1 Tax=Eggerthella lenta TaxID=84112 RepID=UPI000DF7F040|nr:efflux RND transporter periplasmic adaptor subunit [Eggerthella lenta]RDC08417.1 hypothetical protein C1863_00360 [Eggerthella lenta]